jgi:hypothetical protein
MKPLFDSLFSFQFLKKRHSRHDNQLRITFGPGASLKIDKRTGTSRNFQLVPAETKTGKAVFTGLG